MSVDSLGGPSAADVALAQRRRTIEEERGRELDRIEKKRKEEITQANEGREKAVRQVYENSEGEISQKRQDADFKIDRAKQAADARIRDFQNDSARMTDEAKRQFQTKANQLQKTTQELEGQRNYLMKQHSSTMKHLEEERERMMANKMTTRERDVMKLQAQHEKRMGDMRTREEIDVNMLHTDFEDRKRRETADGMRALSRLDTQRQENENQIKSEINLQDRTAAQQLERERTLLKGNLDRQEGQFADTMSDLRIEHNAQVNRTHTLGKRKLSDVATRYDDQIDGLQKHHKKKARDIQTTTALSVGKLEEDAKTQKQLVEQNYRYQQNILETRKGEMLEKKTQDTDALKTRLDAEHALQAKIMRENKEKIITGQYKQDQSEIAFQAERGRKQVNEVIGKASTTVGAHSSKQSDPFYQLHQLNAQVSDSPELLQIQVPIPEHEQDQVRITMQKSKLTLSGTRRAEARTQKEDGTLSTTNTYQSFTETIPFTGAIDMKRMAKTFENGTLTFRIPKVIGQV